MRITLQEGSKMLELMGIVALLVAGAVVFGVAALLFTILKVVFKIALIPVWIALAVLKLVLALVAGVLVLVLAGPVVLAIGIALFIPLLIVGGVIAAGVALVS